MLVGLPAKTISIGKYNSNKGEGTQKNRTCFEMKCFKDAIENLTYNILNSYHVVSKTRS